MDETRQRAQMHREEMQRVGWTVDKDAKIFAHKHTQGRTFAHTQTHKDERTKKKRVGHHQSQSRHSILPAMAVFCRRGLFFWFRGQRQRQTIGLGGGKKTISVAEILDKYSRPSH